MVSMPLLRRKKMPLQPGETFNPRKHIDRRTKDWALDVPASGISTESTFVVSMAHYRQMKEPRPVRLTHGFFSVELPERREQPAKKKTFLARFRALFFGK